MQAPATLARICITGPESTGKTTLAAALADALGTMWVPEASRLHADDVGRPLTATDVEPIARRHLAMAADAEQQASATGARHVVLDTDLVSTLVYARHYYAMEPAWIVTAERARRASLYLLCDVDVPWVADGVRDRPEHRSELLALFRLSLVQRKATIVEVRGPPSARLRIALAAVAALDRGTTRDA